MSVEVDVYMVYPRPDWAGQLWMFPKGTSIVEVRRYINWANGFKSVSDRTLLRRMRVEPVAGIVGPQRLIFQPGRLLR